MKKIFLGLAFFIVVTTGIILAEEIYPELISFVKSKHEAGSEIISIFPYTKGAVDLLEKLRSDELFNKFIITEYSIGPSPSPISSAVLNLHRNHARVELAASVATFVRSEIYMKNLGKELEAILLTELTATNVIQQFLKNNREILRLDYNTKNSDGSTSYGTTFWLCIERNDVDEKIKNTAEVLISHQPDTPANRKTVATNKTILANPISDNKDLIETVRSIMASDPIIEVYKQQNRRLMGFDD